MCELALIEKDNVLSAIRMIDTLYMQPPAPLPPDETPGVRVTLLVSLKSGDVIGDRQIKVMLRPVSGAAIEIYSGTHNFRGGEHGQNLRIHTIISVADSGLLWFDVMETGDVLTSVPLRLVHGRPPERPSTQQTQQT
jgi:hypothetical protein